jgi:dienelactone hydrolase
MKNPASIAILLGAGLLALSATAAPPPALPPLPAFGAMVPATVLKEGTVGEIRFDSRSPYDLDVLLAHLEQAPPTSALGHLRLPTGASATRPVPAMVILPGSGGIAPGREIEMAELLAANGIAGLVVDYYLPRGMPPETPYGLKTIGTSEFDVVVDAYAALRALNHHPSIDAKRIGVMGFSWGGMATRLTMDARLRDALAPDLPAFVAHLDFYGPCYQELNTAKTTGAPLLSLRGGEDASNDLVACASQEAKLRQAGSAVSSVIYAKAGHAWENLTPRKLGPNPYLAGCMVEYDPAGFPSVKGQALIPAGAPIDRATRFKLRATSGPAYGSCVKVGYIVGRDEPVKQQADEQMLRFLRATLQPR